MVAQEDTYIFPGETATIPTGLAFQPRKGYEIQVRPRSGISSKTKLRATFGTVDNGYTGEAGVIVDNVAQIKYELCEYEYTDGYYLDVDRSIWVELLNGNQEAIDGKYPIGTILVRKGDRIAQGVVAPVVHAEFIEEEFDETERGANGYGSSGV